jgi:acid-sensing ion channel 2
MTYDDVNEDLAYTEIPLLCDIGGALGLMLGASVLTFVEVLESVWSFLVKLCNRSHKKVHKMSKTVTYG